MKPYFTEAIKVYDGVFVNPSPHIDRMNHTMQTFFDVTYPISLQNEDIPIEYRTGLVKCRIIYSSEYIKFEYQKYTFRQINNLKLVYNDMLDYSFKYADRTEWNALLEQKAGCDDILIVKNGYITDTSFSNVVFENETGLFTPSTYLLAGTKRQSLLQKGIIKEAEISIENIGLYSKLYLINTMIDIEDNLCIDTSSLI
ncbi:MAG: aminotransferase class IV [Dysgonomonas sp.]|jgi:4-amino-4-deoxychorismate lyase|nr:aminotransferase class IV [Prevotella sp.]